MRNFIVKYKTIIGLLCGVLAFIVIARFHMHYERQKECPDTQYEILDGVLYCDYEGNLFKPKVYKRLIK